MNEQIDDKAFDEYLGRQSSVSQQYRALDALDARDVPPDLDRLVLDRASQAVEKKHRNRSGAWRTWSVPVALAASTILAVAVVIESGVEPKPAAQKEGSLQAPSAVNAPVVEERPTAAEAPVEARSAEVVKTEPAPAASPSPATSPSAAAPPPTAANSPPDRRALADAKRTQQAAAERQRTSDERELERVTVTSARPDETLAMESPAAVMAVEQDDLAPAPEDQRAASASRSESASTGALSLEEIVMTAQRRQDRAFGPRGTLMRRNASGAADVSESDAEEQRRESDPALWLEFIRELRRDRKREEADREWSEFRSIYPDYAVAETDAARPPR